MEKAKTDHRLAVANGSTDPTLALGIAQSSNNPFGITRRRECEHSLAYF